MYTNAFAENALTHLFMKEGAAVSSSSVDAMEKDGHGVNKDTLRKVLRDGTKETHAS